MRAKARLIEPLAYVYEDDGALTFNWDAVEAVFPDGFVDAMRDALRAYVAFAGATRLEWAPHLAKEKRRIGKLP